MKPAVRGAAVAAAIVCGMGAASAASALAEPVVVSPTAPQGQDTFVYQGIPGMNFDDNGFEQFIVLGKSTAGHELRGLIRFDLAGLSIAADEKATLNLYVGDTTSTGFPGYSPTPATAVVANVAAAGAAWDPATVTWQSGVPAGDVVDAVTIDGIDRWVSFDVTSQVGDWIDQPTTNYGFVLSQAAAVGGPGWVGLVFDASAGANRPYLEIATVPEPAGLATLAIAAWAIGRRKRATIVQNG